MSKNKMIEDEVFEVELLRNKYSNMIFVKSIMSNDNIYVLKVILLECLRHIHIMFDHTQRNDKSLSKQSSHS